MQFLMGFAGIVSLLAVTASATRVARDSANPLGQVLSLLDSLTAKITKEGEEEEKAFKTFVEWCDDASRNKGFEIKTATSKKEELEAAISKTTATAEAAGTRIEELAGSISSDEADLKSATVVRQKEAADFLASETELVDVVNTIGRAITVLEREMAKNPASFAQMDVSNMDNIVKSLSALVDAASFTSADKQKLLSMVQSQQSSASDDEDLSAPAAAAYKSHSTNIVDVLEDMKEKAEEQLAELRKAEVSAKHNYDMLKQSLEDQNDADSKDLAEEKLAKAGALEAKATAEGDLAETVKDLSDAKAALEVAQTSCMTAASDHAASKTSRAEELEAIAKAKTALEESTSGAATQTYASFLQRESQHGSSLRTQADLANAEVVTIVKRLAKEQHSEALAQLASRIGAILRYGTGTGEDPFAKVKTLISDLIVRLEEEAQGEAGEKAYCDEQLQKTETKKGELDFKLSKLTAKIDQSVAKSASLKEEVQQLQSELAALAREQATMDKIRRESHSAYAEAKTDLEQGLQGVRKALSVLREFYGGESSAAAMVQQGGGLAAAMEQPAAPVTHSKAAGSGTSIIGLLEVVESDFAKNLAAEEAAEDDAETQYQKTTMTNKVTTKLKNQDVKYKTQEAKTLDKSVAELTGDRETADAELSAVLDYYAKIKERCIAKPMTYEERKARREAEIKGLKEALTILEDEAAFMQRKSKKGLRGHYLTMSRS